MLKVAEKTLTVTLTNTAVLYLRAYKTPPGQDEICDKHSGGTMQCDASIMQVQAYTLNEILKKSLLLLIPFFIFSHEISYRRQYIGGRNLSICTACPVLFMWRRKQDYEKRTPNNRSIRRVLVLFLGVFILQIFKKSVVVHLKKFGKCNQLRYTNIVGSTFNL